MKLHLVFIIFFVMSSCSSENNQTQSKEDIQSGDFSLKLSDGIEFTHESKRFKIKNASSDYFEFEASDWHTRFSASHLDETAPSQSTDLIYNNTFVSFYQSINGKRTKVSCKPSQDPVGEIKITEINNQTYSGEFTFELVKCTDFYSGNHVKDIQVPFTATGTFYNIAYKNHLEELMKKRN